MTIWNKPCRYLRRGGLLCVLLMLSRPGFGASCISNADEVALRGTATAEHLKGREGREALVWILTTENPLCINVLLEGDTAQKSQTYISRIQILGATPPTGALIDVRGILRTGTTSYTAVPAAITVGSIKLHKDGEVAVVPEAVRKDEPESKPRKTVSRSREPESKVQVVPKAVTEALQKAQQMALLFKVDSLEIELDETPGALGYSIYLHYSKDGFTGHWEGQESIIAFDNDYNLAREFVKQLINTGQDPAAKSSPRYVDVCSEIDGVDALSKQAQFELIGCARYTPEKDMIDPDFTRISDRAAMSK